MAAANPDELLQLEGQMRAADAIMEPGMADVVGAYIRAGGKPEEVIESLTTSYAGCAQMASLVCSWIRLVDAPYAPPGAAGGSSAFDAAPSAGASTSQADLTPDEFTLLQELAKERFDPEALLSVFRRGRPTWLHELTADARGRRLILDLSAEHHSSIFLNYAIRRIFDTGHADEVAAVGASLSSYFEVYHRLLARTLENAATAATAAQLERLSADLVEACTASQHTYVHAQHLLAHLAGRRGGGVFRRLSQDLEAAAVERHGGAKVWAMQPMFVPRDASQQHREAVQLVSRALVLGPGSGATGGAVLTQASQPLSQLQDLYARTGDSCPQEALRHPKMLQTLLEGLFSWQQPPSPAVQRTAASLLAMAAAAGGAGCSAPDAQAHLETARGLAARAAAGEKLGESDLAAAEATARTLTLAGLGLLHLAAGVLGAAATYEDDRCVASVPSLVALLRSIASAQQQQGPAVVQALQGALCAMGARRPDLAERVGGALVELLLGGWVTEVLGAAESWAVGGADPSLVRAFTLKVLERAGPPYTQHFARPLLRLMLAGNMGTAKKGNMLVAGGAVERLREFAVECLDTVDFVPALTDAEVELLERLAA